jgi:hypothetical protein
MFTNIETMLQICNAINMAIADGKTVHVGNIEVAGAIVTKYRLLAIVESTCRRMIDCPYHNKVLFGFAQFMQISRKHRIIVTESKDVEIIYEPVAAETTALKPDLHKETSNDTEQTDDCDRRRF